MGAVSRLRIAMIALPTTSCFGAPDYQCTASSECVRGELQGTCEPSTSRCSYPDAECPSGARYSDQAGELANACVDGDAPTDTTTAETSSSSSSGSTAPASTDESTSSAPIPECGNSIPEPGEACDDGNAIDGDGCNVDCRTSGSPRWDPPERVHSGADDADAQFWDVDVRPDDTIVAVGLEEVTDRDALFVLYSADGDVVWARQYDRGTGDDTAFAVTSAVGSEIYAIGSSPNPTEQAGWLATIEPADGDVEEFAFTGRTFATGLAHMHPSRFVVGGYGGGFVGARAFSDDLTPVWTAESAASGSISAAAADGVADIAWTVGNVDGHARLHRLAPGEAEPIVVVYDGPEGSGSQGLAYAADALFIGGYVGLGMRDGWVQRIATDGSEAWSWSSAEPGEDEVEDVTLAPTGHIVAVGFGTEHAQDTRVWKLTPDGELSWTWTWAEPVPDDDVARGVAVHPDGDVIVVGGRTADDGATDAWVVRLTP